MSASTDVDRNASKFAVVVLGVIIVAAIAGVLMLNHQEPTRSSDHVDTSLPSATNQQSTAAYKLAVYDGSSSPDAAIVARYQTALDSLKQLCKEDEDKLAGEILASWTDLEKNHVTDETNLTLIGHNKGAIDTSIAPTDCSAIMATYLTLRESGS
jgi:hypothetical protein